MDLTPLRHCLELVELHLENNQLSEVDLTPLNNCPGLIDLNLDNNRLTEVDLTPLQQSNDLWGLVIDPDTQLIALESLQDAPWPDEIEKYFERIKWKTSNHILSRRASFEKKVEFSPSPQTKEITPEKTKTKQILNILQ